MPKFEFDPEKNVNTNAWYDEAIIFKIWDQYIKSKKLKYFYYNSDSFNNKEHYIESLFEGKDESLLSKNSAILLNKDNSLYTRENVVNNDICSISFCNLVNTPKVKKGLFNFSQREDYLKIALRQLMEWNRLYPNSKNTIKNHIIMFPYNVSNNHWCLGTLQINFNFSTIDTYLHVHDPSKITNTFSKNFIKKINQILISSFLNYKITLVNKNNKSSIKQQNDSNSCGVIVAENGKDIINGFDEKIKEIYPAGAKNLRIQHLKEIANDIFTIRQRENKHYTDPQIKLLDNLAMIENGLSNIFNKDDQINLEIIKILDQAKNNIQNNEVTLVGNIRNLFLKYKIYFKDYFIENKNLFELFFSDENGSYRDKAFDTLSYIIQKLIDNEKNNQIKLNYDYKNIYYYPERIPNLVKRNYLESKIEQELKANRIAILTGFNGYGKTILAMEYIYKHLNSETEYDYIVWLDHQELSSTSLHLTNQIKYIIWDKGTRSFNKTIKHLILDNEQRYDNNSHSITDIHKIISQEILDKTWLIVYDNVTNYTDLSQESIPPNGHIICTSRHKDWSKSINVGPFTLEEGAQYFTNIFFQSSESAAIEQYRDKYFENMLGTPDKAQCFQKSAKELTKKLHGHPLALAIAARDINEKGLTVEKYLHKKKYKELSYFKDITLESFIGVDLSKIKNGDKAKQLLYYCAYLNHEGITREVLESIDESQNEFNSKSFNQALSLLIYYSIINTDSSHTTDYFYIPGILKKLFLNNLNNNEYSSINNDIAKIINKEIKNHIFINDCMGKEIIAFTENIYMWIAHAKSLYKKLEWREKFDNKKINHKNKGYRLIDISNIIKLYITTKLPNSKNIAISNLINSCYLLMRANRKKYTCIDPNDGYNYSFIISLSLTDIFLITQPNKSTINSNLKISFLNKIVNSNSNSHYKILIPYINGTYKKWITIEIRLHKFIFKNNTKFELELLAHDSYGNGNLLNNALKKVSSKLLNHFEEKLKNTKPNLKFNSKIINSNFNSQLQKNDTTSSSIIVIENIIDIIHGNTPNKTYPFGCKLIRYQHLSLIERCLPVQENKIWYNNINKSKIKPWKKFLECHWGLDYVLKKFKEAPENIDNTKDTLAMTAEFIHSLGYWYYYHEISREKSYVCFLESRALYFQLICAKVLLNIQSDYDLIYNNHLKDSYNFEITSHQLISSDYKISHEAPAIHLSLSHIIKTYTQLDATYNYYINNLAPFELNRESMKQQSFNTLYCLSIALQQEQKGFNPKTHKWMKSIYKLFIHLLKNPFSNTNLKITTVDEEILINLLPNNTTDNILFDNFIKYELNGSNLKLLELKQTRLKTSQLKAHLKTILEYLKIPKNVVNYYKNYDSIKFPNILSIKNYMSDLIFKYISNYYSLISQNIIVIYDKFLKYSESYNTNPDKIKDIKNFISFFTLEPKKFNSLYKITDDKAIINIPDVYNSIIEIHDKKNLYKYISQKINLKFINDEYFYKDYQILIFFYKIIYRKLNLTFLQSFTDEQNRKHLTLKLYLLNYIIGQISDDVINSKRNLIFGLSLQRLRIKIQLEIYFLYWHFDANTKQKLKYLPNIYNELDFYTNKYYETLVEHIETAKSNDIEEIFQSSGRLFYQVAKTAFRHFKIIYRIDPPDPIKKLNITQNKLFIFVTVNLQRAVNSHKIRLLQPNHPSLSKADKLYNETIKYLGFITDENDKNRRIGNLIDIECLEKKLNTFNRYLTSHHVPDAINDNDKFRNIIRARINRAMICYMLGRFDEALNDCNILCNEHKAYFKAFHLRAHLYYNLSKFTEAIADFKYYLTYCPGDYNAKVWLSFTQKQQVLKLEHTPQQQFTDKMLFINQFTDEFLIKVKYYADNISKVNKKLNKAEMRSRIFGALSNLLPNVGIPAPVGSFNPIINIKPQEAGIELSRIFVQQTEAQKQYIASNIIHYHDELKNKIQIIAKNIANDLEPQINQLQDKSILKLAKYSAKRMLKNVGLNKTNPELPIEQQLRQGLFFSDTKLKHGKYLFTKADHSTHWIFTKRWTAEGLLTCAGIFTTSNHFWVQRKATLSKGELKGEDRYSYRYGTNDEAFRLGYKQVNKDTKYGKEHESKYRIAIPFPMKQ